MLITFGLIVLLISITFGLIKLYQQFYRPKQATPQDLAQDFVFDEIANDENAINNDFKLDLEAANNDLQELKENNSFDSIVNAQPEIEDALNRSSDFDESLSKMSFDANDCVVLTTTDSYNDIADFKRYGQTDSETSSIDQDYKHNNARDSVIISDMIPFRKAVTFSDILSIDTDSSPKPHHNDDKLLEVIVDNKTSPEYKIARQKTRMFTSEVKATVNPVTQDASCGWKCSKLTKRMSFGKKTSIK